MANILNSYDYANIFTTYLDENGFEFFNLSNGIDISGELDGSLYDYDLVHDFTSWYEISNKHYGTPRLWWITLVANNIKNPFDVVAGTRVKILKTQVVTQIVSMINTSK
jgi:hypothetical protein